LAVILGTNETRRPVYSAYKNQKDNKKHATIIMQFENFIAVVSELIVFLNKIESWHECSDYKKYKALQNKFLLELPQELRFRVDFHQCMNDTRHVIDFGKRAICNDYWRTQDWIVGAMVLVAKDSVKMLEMIVTGANHGWAPNIFECYIKNAERSFKKFDMWHNELDRHRALFDVRRMNVKMTAVPDGYTGDITGVTMTGIDMSTHIKM
jgi:hypothetical protein